jgi:hypothetical protein
LKTIIHTVHIRAAPEAVYRALTAEVGVKIPNMQPKLTIHPVKRGWRMMAIGRPTAYEVRGLPISQEAMIEEFGDDRWKVLRKINGQSIEPEGDYGTPEEALVYLESKL